jgi:hypothetical protein
MYRVVPPDAFDSQKIDHRQSQFLESRVFGNFDGEVASNLLWEVYAAAIQSCAKLSARR